MIKLVRLLLALVGVIVIVMLAVDNRGIVEVDPHPLPPGTPAVITWS